MWVEFRCPAMHRTALQDKELVQLQRSTVS